MREKLISYKASKKVSTLNALTIKVLADELTSGWVLDSLKVILGTVRKIFLWKLEKLDEQSSYSV